MPRRRAPARRPVSFPGGPYGSAGSSVRVETGVDGHPYAVRPVPGARAVKVYRCPGCDHEIRPRTPHVVVWPADEPGCTGDTRGAVDADGIAARRHWHTPCWKNRTRRGPTRKWS